MDSQPQNPEFRNNPENFHPWQVYSKRDGSLVTTSFDVNSTIFTLIYIYAHDMLFSVRSKFLNFSCRKHCIGVT